jgi:hypothetical protein
MEFRQGDRVQVNLAPFIGSRRRSRHSVPCRVLALCGACVEVEPEPPYRPLRLQVLPEWIDASQAPEPRPSTAISAETAEP